MSWIGTVGRPVAERHPADSTLHRTHTTPAPVAPVVGSSGPRGPADAVAQRWELGAPAAGESRRPGEAAPLGTPAATPAAVRSQPGRGQEGRR